MQSNIDPVRLQQTIPTFPYFQLSHFGSLVAELGLTTSSYLDTYNPSTGQWEQHTVKTVRLVESQQRVLYRVRKSLLEGICEDECLSLHEEVQTQLRPNHINVSSPLVTIKPSNKRPATEALETGHAQKIHVTNGYYPAIAVPPTPSSMSPTSVSPNGSPTNNNATTTPGGYIYQAAPFYSSPPPTSTASPASPSTSILPPYLTAPHAPTPPIPYHPHPPLKRWPNDYTVSELANGFLAMETLVSQSSMTQRAAFERVFGSRYVKSTVCRHRAVWRRANRALREQFEAMGSDERACWGEFVRRVEGRPPGKGVQEFAAVYAEREGMSRQSVTENMGEPSVMDSLQNSSNAGQLWYSFIYLPC